MAKGPYRWSVAGGRWPVTSDAATVPLTPTMGVANA